MGKVTIYMGIISMVLLMFHFAGLVTGTPLDSILRFLIDPQNFQNFSIVQQISTILAGVGVAGLIIGSISPQRTQWILNTSFVLLLIAIGWELIAIFNVLKQTSVMLATFIIAPMMLIYILSVFEWWNGRD